MAHIFISYSHEDRVNAEIIAERLKRIGYQPWIDFHGIFGGEEWRKSIDHPLEQAFALVVLLTPSSAVSEWVRYECVQAAARQIPVIPLQTRPCELPDFLEKYHYINFLQGFDAAFEHLQRALLVAVSTPAAAEPSDAAGRRALVVEDSPDTQELIRDICIEFGLAVDTASSRIEAIPLMKSGTYDFITLDMQLSPTDTAGESGLFLLDLWKEYQPQTPLVIISRLPWPKDKMREFFKKYAVLDVLDKPLTPAELRGHLRDTIGGES